MQTPSVNNRPRARRSNRRLRSLVRARGGMAATEFAMIMPILATIFFGMLEGADALTTSRKVANATNSLVDLVAQEPEITMAEADSIFLGVRRMLEPTDTSTIGMKLISLIRDPNDSDRIIVHWSRDDDGQVPYAPGAEFTTLEDDDVLKEGISLVYVEMTYDYRNNLTHKVFGSPIRFEKEAARLPRRSTRVQLCTNEADPDDRTCTS